MTVYDRIKELRREAGMTQDDLAKAMGYSDRSMITKIEAWKVDLSTRKISQFAKVLNTSIAHLMGWDEDNVGAVLGQAFDEYYKAERRARIAEQREAEREADELIDIFLSLSAENRVSAKKYLLYLKSQQEG